MMTGFSLCAPFRIDFASRPGSRCTIATTDWVGMFEWQSKVTTDPVTRVVSIDLASEPTLAWPGAFVTYKAYYDQMGRIRWMKNRERLPRAAD